MDKWLRSRAKAMRSAPKASEDRLWEVLRGRRAGGLKFHRQVPIGRYIADFACFDPRVIVEVDGCSHAELEERDAQRDAWFAANLFQVLRYSSDECWAAPIGVRKQILHALGRAGVSPGDL